MDCLSVDKGEDNDNNDECFQSSLIKKPNVLYHSIDKSGNRKPSMIIQNIDGQAVRQYPIQTEQAYQWLRSNMMLNKNDVMIVSYPKTGQTMTQQLCTAIMYYYEKCLNVKNGFYYNENNNYQLPLYLDKTFWIEVFVSRILRQDKSTKKFDQHIQQSSNSIRFWKTHADFNRLPLNIYANNNNNNGKQQGKFIIVIRDPKDTLVSGKFFWPETSYVRWLHDDTLKLTRSKNSEYNDKKMSKFIPYHKSHYQKLFDINTAYDWFVSGMVPFGSYWQFYSDYYFLLKYIVKDVDKQVLWLYYEDLVNDKKNSILKIVHFLGLNQMLSCDDSQQIITNIINQTSIQGMRKILNDDKKQRINPHFVRKGINGDWKNYLSSHQAKTIDNITKNRFAGTNIGHKTWYSSDEESQFTSKCKL